MLRRNIKKLKWEDKKDSTSFVSQFWLTLCAVCRNRAMLQKGKCRYHKTRSLIVVFSQPLFLWLQKSMRLSSVSIFSNIRTLTLTLLVRSLCAWLRWILFNWPNVHMAVCGIAYITNNLLGSNDNHVSIKCAQCHTQGGEGTRESGTRGVGDVVNTKYASKRPRAEHFLRMN